MASALRAGREVAACEPMEDEEEVPLARQLRGFLLEALWRWARPASAQALLQVRLVRRGVGPGRRLVRLGELMR